jgi:predicted permease
MARFKYLFHRIQSLLRSEQLHGEILEELSFHIDERTKENIRRGMSAQAARQEAEQRFGRLSRIREQGYELRSAGWVEDLLQDVRYELRTLFNHRYFSFATVLTLALGIGACTAIFSLVNAVLLRSLPYGEPEKLVYLFTPNVHLKLPAEVFGPSDADFFDLQTQNHSFADMTLFQQAVYNLAVGDKVERVGAAKVDADFFTTLRSGPEIGRAFDTNDEQAGSEHVVVLSHALWVSMFGGRSDVLGKSLWLDGQAYHVIGVMPKDFGFPHKSDLKYGNGHIDMTQLWLPSALTQQEKAYRDGGNGEVVARLNPGVTLRQAQADVRTLMSQINLLHSEHFPRGWTGLLRPFRDSALGPVRPLMWLLLGAVGFVFLIACGNAANLLLARAAGRSSELGIRAALGARQSRLLRQLLTESLMLSLSAGVIGIGLAYLFLHGLLKLNPGDIPRMQDANIDLRVLWFAFAVSVVTGAMFGILPAISATRVSVTEFLKSGGMRGVVGDRKQARKVLVMAQVALVVILLTGAGLLLRSYEKVVSVPRGFADSTIAMNVSLSPEYATGEKQKAFLRELLDRIRQAHGVESVGLVDCLPLSNSESLSFFEAEGYPNEKRQLVESRRITPDYLSAMQIRLIKGRTFNDSDQSGSLPVAVVNQAFADKYFPGMDASGRHIRDFAKAPWITIVGVIGDVRNTSLEAAAPPQIYYPLWQRVKNEAPLMNGVYVTVRSTLPSGAVASEIRAAARGLNPTLAISDVHMMGDLVSQASARRRFQTTLLIVFSTMATFLAFVGVYGLLAYSVRQRTGEIGLRMALGSSRTSVLRLILREGFRLVGIGLALGLIASLALTRLLQGFLYGVGAFDPTTFLVVPIMLLIATLVACLIPSCKAAAVDPINALRYH